MCVSRSCDLESWKARRLSSSWQPGMSEAQPKLLRPAVSNIILMKLSIAVGILSFRHAALLRTSLSSSYPKRSSSSFLQNALSAIGSFPFGGGDGSRVLLNRAGPGLRIDKKENWLPAGTSPAATGSARTRSASRGLLEEEEEEGQGGRVQSGSHRRGPCRFGGCGCTTTSGMWLQ